MRPIIMVSSIMAASILMVRPNRWARPSGWRVLIAALGTCAIRWALDVIPVYRASDSIIQTAQRILAGEKFTSAQLDTMIRDWDEASGKMLLASALSGAVTIRSRLL